MVFQIGNHYGRKIKPGEKLALRQYCPNGHDTFVVGRHIGGQCKLCHREFYRRLSKTENAVCGIHQSELNRSLHVDHDHKTGIFRGLLCVNCNSKGGTLENEEFILKWGKYAVR